MNDSVEYNDIPLLGVDFELFPSDVTKSAPTPAPAPAAPPLPPRTTPEPAEPTAPPATFGSTPPLPPSSARAHEIEKTPVGSLQSWNTPLTPDELAVLYGGPHGTVTTPVRRLTSMGNTSHYVIEREDLNASETDKLIEWATGHTTAPPTMRRVDMFSPRIQINDALLDSAASTPHPVMGVTATAFIGDLLVDNFPSNTTDFVRYAWSAYTGSLFADPASPAVSPEPEPEADTADVETADVEISPTSLVEPEPVPPEQPDYTKPIARPNGDLYYPRKMTIGRTTTWDVELIRKAYANKIPVLISGPPGVGKGLSLDTRIPTSDGWITMGALAVGDTVLGPDGEPTTVTLTSPVHNLPCYKITFTDGTSLVADETHRWSVRDRAEYERHPRGSWGYVTMTTARLAELGTRHRDHRRWQLPVVQAAELPKAELPLDPYVLGAYLGDGHRSTSAITKPQQDLWDEIENRGYITKPLGSVGSRTRNVDTRSIWIGDGSRTIMEDLRNLGCLHVRKIPPSYLRASKAQRLDLLRGIVDTDGYAGKCKSATIEIVTIVESFAHDLCELIRSLGWIPGYGTGRATIDGIDKGPKYRITFSPDESVGYTSRILDNHRTLSQIRYRTRWIDTIEPVDSVPTKCIQVDNADHLYLAGEGWTPTHNTALIEAALQDIVTLSGTSDTETADFVGSYIQQSDRRFVWIDGPLVEAIERDVPFFIDEIALIDPRVLALTYSLLDGRNEIRITANPARGILRPGPGFYIIAACNPDVPGAVMSDALLSRFLLQPDMSTDYDTLARLGIPENIIIVARNLAKKAQNGEIMRAPETRELLAYKQIHEAMGQDIALSNFVSAALPNDRDVYSSALRSTFGRDIHILRN